MKMRSQKKALYLRLFNKQKLAMSERTPEKVLRRGSWLLFESELMRVFANDKCLAWQWFTGPVMALDNKKPADLVASGRSEIVQDLLVRLEYCVYT